MERVTEKQVPESTNFLATKQNPLHFSNIQTVKTQVSTQFSCSFVSPLSAENNRPTISCLLAQTVLTASYDNNNDWDNEDEKSKQTAL